MSALCMSEVRQQEHRAGHAWQACGGGGAILERSALTMPDHDIAQRRDHHGRRHHRVGLLA
jgi:hypothetical protein